MRLNEEWRALLEDTRNLAVGVIGWLDTALRPKGVREVPFGEAPSPR